MTALDLFATRLAATGAVTPPRPPRRRHWTRIAEEILTGIAVCVAGLAVGFGLAWPS